MAAGAILVGDICRLARRPKQRLRERQVGRVERRGRLARMTGQARVLAGAGLPVIALGRGRVGGAVADRAVAKILRKAHFGVAVLAVLVAPDRVVLATGGQQLAGVDLVHHRLHGQHIAAVGISGAGVVAHHAVLDIDPAAAMQRQLVVAAIARGDIGHHPGLGRIGHRHRLASGVEGDVEVRIDLDGLAARVNVAELDRNPMGAVRLEGHAAGLRRVGQVGAELVRVVAIGVVDELVGKARWLGIGGGLPRAGQHRAAAGAHTRRGGLGARYVALPAVDLAIGAGHQLGNRHADVRQRQPLLDRPVGEHREVDDLRATDHDHRRHAVVLKHLERRRCVRRAVVRGRRRGRADHLTQLTRRGRWRAVAASSTAAARHCRQHQGQRPDPANRPLHLPLHRCPLREHASAACAGLSGATAPRRWPSQPLPNPHNSRREVGATARTGIDLRQPATVDAGWLAIVTRIGDVGTQRLASTVRFEPGDLAASRAGK